jgi:methylamine dehydrogenase light chain
MSRVDAWVESSVRDLARRTTRRGLLARTCALLFGASALPLLPIARGAPQPSDSSGAVSDPGDPRTCEYWRHCAIDGFLCSCCGGTQHSCPPGTEPSAITWIGTCHNPADNTDYVISYNDCCGKSSCGRCFCNRNEGDSSLFQPGKSNDYNWCSGNSKANIPYHCSTARIVGAAK